MRRLPMTRELSAKLTEGEKNNNQHSDGLSLRHREAPKRLLIVLQLSVNDGAFLFL